MANRLRNIKLNKVEEAFHKINSLSLYHTNMNCKTLGEDYIWFSKFIWQQSTDNSLTLTPDWAKHLNFITLKIESYWIYLLCSEELKSSFHSVVCSKFKGYKIDLSSILRMTLNQEFVPKSGAKFWIIRVIFRLWMLGWNPDICSKI